MAEIQPIYTVTVFNVYRNGVRDETAHNGSRTWGWFPTRELAEEALRSEDDDLYFESGTYQYALIEEVPPGLMGGLQDERQCWWFNVVYEHLAYTVFALANPPEFAEGIIGFSMG